MAYKGILIPIGGNEDKGSDIDDDGLDFLTEGILSQVVAESGGLEASILVITTASKIPVEVGENYISAFNLLGCSNIEILDIRTSGRIDLKSVALSLMVIKLKLLILTRLKQLTGIKRL